MLINIVHRVLYSTIDPCIHTKEFMYRQFIKNSCILNFSDDFSEVIFTGGSVSFVSIQI